MCDVHDAERCIRLAKLCEKENDKEKARINYLEASSIFTMQSVMHKKDADQSEELLKKASWCYGKSRQMLGKSNSKEFTAQELAKITLDELHDEGHEVCSHQHNNSLLKDIQDILQS